MTDSIFDCGNTRILELTAHGTLLRTDRDAVDVISATRSANANLAAIPAERFDPDFFSLKTRLAGEFLQKFVTYGVRVAILGDISAKLSESKALRDFVLECNKGQHIWFVRDRDELCARLG
jgi:Domain of unknown function (DUF4180)